LFSLRLCTSLSKLVKKKRNLDGRHEEKRKLRNRFRISRGRNRLSRRRKKEEFWWKTGREEEIKETNSEFLEKETDS
jgi:hypothetical protein